ncbi:hypothetical protein K2P47_02725 [Patescibacteria group bacterium]|nr:hypothetical protein [Patescibacteria group bacterium]
MSQKTIITGLCVGAFVIIGGLYYLMSTPGPADVEPVLTATSTETMSNQEPIKATTTDDIAVPAVTTSTPTEAKPAATEVKPVSAKPVTSTPEPTPAPKPVTPAPTPSPTPTPTPTPTPQPPVAAVGITMQVVATHNDASSCWSVIDGKVYDLTSYVPKHPGGKSEILAICGRDGSSMFNGQHGGDAKPERVLAGYYLNVLAN